MDGAAGISRRDAELIGMLNTTMGTRGMVTAPHHMAAEAGRDVLRENGTATEAMIAAAAVIAVVYPHMNAIGGDGFWLVSSPGEKPVGIDACGPAARLATRAWYRERGWSAIPARGPAGALTVPGTIGGWRAALSQAAVRGGNLPLSRLLEPAMALARDGVPVTAGQAALTQAKLSELRDLPGFSETFLDAAGCPLDCGARLHQPTLADTLEHLGRVGLHDFYRGDIARSMAGDLEAMGSPLRLDDFMRYEALTVEPLSLRVGKACLYNMPPPTQGLASLLILGIHDRVPVPNDRVPVPNTDEFRLIHGLVESTKQAFLIRDTHVTDPHWMTVNPDDLLTDERLNAAAGKIDPTQAAPWPDPGPAGDTVWMGAMDSEGQSVSFIQSVYWEYGTGVVLPDSGVLMQNRGMSFGLDAAHSQALEPGRRPFHTLNPAMASFDDGRHMVYGTMGGEGQPQTQAAIFTRYAHQGLPLQKAVTAPRWLLGRTWGDSTSSLKLESRFPARLVEQLEEAGHNIELAADFDSMMGHAGAIVRHPDGLLEGATDPRSDGAVSAS